MSNKKLPFPTFQEDPQEYGLAKSFWNNFFKDLVSSYNVSFQTFHNTQNNEKQFLDGNPIFDAYFPNYHRLIRIIQFLPEPDDLLITAWVDQVDPAMLEEGLKPTPIDPNLKYQIIPELVIHLALTKNTTKVAEQLIKLWMTEKIDIEKVEVAINDILDQA